MTLTATQDIASVGPNTLVITGTNGVNATLVSGPTPASGTVGTGGTTFTWVYNTSGTGSIGQLTFGGDADDGGSNTWPWAQSNSVIVAPPLTFQVTVDTVSPPALVENTAYISDESGGHPRNAQQHGRDPDRGQHRRLRLGRSGRQRRPGYGRAGPERRGSLRHRLGVTTVCDTTDASGAYLITGLDAGTWTTSLNLATLPADYLPTTPTSLTCPGHPASSTGRRLRPAPARHGQHRRHRLAGRGRRWLRQQATPACPASPCASTSMSTTAAARPW